MCVRLDEEEDEELEWSVGQKVLVWFEEEDADVAGAYWEAKVPI